MENQTNASDNSSAITIKEEEVNYQIEGINYPGYIYYDDAQKGKRPGILVVDEWWGLTDYGRDRARQLARLGYISMAVDMFGNGKTVEDPASAQELSSTLYNDPKLAQTRLEVAMDFLKSYPQTESTKMGAIGYCFGGFVVLNAAKLGSDLKGVVSFHGSLGGVKPDTEKMKAKVLVCHGANDAFENSNVENFKKEMDEAGVDYTFITYPGASHAFSNPKATERGEKYQIPTKYNEAAAHASWNEMKAFFKEIFRDPVT